MSDSNESEDLLKELEAVTSQPQLPASKDASVLDKVSASVQQESSAKENEEKKMAQESSVASSENGQEQNVFTSNKIADLVDKTDDGPSCAVAQLGSVEIERDAPLLASSDTMSAAGSPNLPEIIPNSETHVSDISGINKEDMMDSMGSNEEAEGLVKEESIDDVVETSELNTCFSISPSFEAKLDSKFKPTIRLEKININSGLVKEETNAETVSDEETNVSEDESCSSRRPRRSIKTPAHLATGFVLNTKDTKPKSLQRANAVEAKSEKVTPSKVVKIVRENFIPIKPKPPDAGKSKNTTITIVKSPLKTTQVKTPGVDKQRGVSHEAKEMVRKLNADSVPSILKRTKRKADESGGGGVQPHSKSAPPPKKEKVEPPKKQPRKHRKVFDYESYLRDHLEAEVNDKKPKSSSGSGAPFQLVSSPVGVNVLPSKTKVTPFSNSSSAVKTSLRNTNENESNNVERTKERTLYNLMEDVSHMLPSWNLHVLPDSNSFCIAQVCRSRSGIPTLKTSIELDAQFNAKVFIHQLHCKRYDGVYDSEESISALIQEIDAFSK